MCQALLKSEFHMPSFIRLQALGQFTSSHDRLNQTYIRSFSRYVYVRLRLKIVQKEGVNAL